MFNEVGILHFLLGFVLGHVCGSVPSGLWLVQAFHGIDIRNYGSKNIGTTNVFRTVGPKTALRAEELGLRVDIKSTGSRQDPPMPELLSNFLAEQEG